MAVGLIITLFFKEYVGDVIPFPILWLLLGLAFLAGGAYLTFPFPFTKTSSEETKYLRELEEFKKRADTRRIDLDACEIRNSSYYEEVQQESYSISGDPLSSYAQHYYNNAPKQSRRINQVVLVLEMPYQGATRKFVSPHIPKDETTVRFKMAAAKNTTLYIDPENPEHYFLDVGFLES